MRNYSSINLISGNIDIDHLPGSDVHGGDQQGCGQVITKTNININQHWSSWGSLPHLKVLVTGAKS